MTDTAVMTGGFEELAGRLAAEAEEGLFHTAAQLVVRRHGETLVDLAVGTTHRGGPFQRSTLSCLYCTGKPLVGVAVLRLVAEGELSLDDRLGHVIDGLDTPWLAERTVEEVLSHTAGLHGVNTILARILPERSREAWIYGTEPPAGWRFGADGSYSEFGGWFLLGRLIESLTEQPYDRYVRDAVLEPYGVAPEDMIVRFDEAGWAAERERISVTFDLTGLERVPLLAEAGPETACEWNPAFGVYGTMRGLADFYSGVLADLDGAGAVLPSELVRRAVTPRPHTFDVTLQRDATFGLGFMCDLTTHHFGPDPSPSSFGHAGQGGTSFGMADPESGLVVASLFNAGLDADTALQLRRAQFVRALYRAVAST